MVQRRGRVNKGVFEKKRIQGVVAMSSMVNRYKLDRILFARIGWDDRYQGGTSMGNFRDDCWWDQYNFRVSGAWCYGSIAPMGEKETPPKPVLLGGWMVVFVAPEEGNGQTVPVGFYADADFQENYEPRPDELPDSLGNPCGFCVRAFAEDTYLIPVEKRRRYALPAEVTSHFTRTFAYACGNAVNEDDPWRVMLTHTAKTLWKARRGFIRMGQPGGLNG
jgi:hypothetical protein